jgi:glucose-1-phosphate adenylyltransferase
MDYDKLIKHHIDHKAEITIATIPVDAAQAPGFGILKTNEENNIIEFREKPPADSLSGLESNVSEKLQGEGRVYLASMGIYVFNREVLREELKKNAESTDFGKEIIPGSIGKRTVASYPFTGYWTDVGTIRSFYEANLELVKQQPVFDLYNPERPIYTNMRMLPPSKIENSSIVNSMISEGSVVLGSSIENSIIGIRTFIAKGCTIKKSVLMGADYYPWHPQDVRERQDGPTDLGIAENTCIENSIIDKNVYIGKNCVIRNKENIQEGEGPGFYIRDHLVIIPKNTRIPDDTHV